MPDYNDNGFGEVVVGARLDRVNTSNTGKVYVFDGGTGAMLGQVFLALNQVAHFGHSVCWIPNAADAPLIAIGAREQNKVVGMNTFDRAGWVHVANMRSGGSNITHSIDTPNHVINGNFGESVAPVADLNSDGIFEILIGAPRETVSGVLNRGRIYVADPATGLITTTVLQESAATTRFGLFVTSVPDVSVDGIPEILSGSEISDCGGPAGAGCVWLHNPVTGLGIAEVIPPAPGLGNAFGASVAGLVDFNGDGLGDIAAGEPASEGTGHTPFSGILWTLDGQTFSSFIPPTPTPAPTGPSPTPTTTRTPTPTRTPTRTPTATPSRTPTPSPSPTPPATPTTSRTPTPSPTNTASPTPTPFAGLVINEILYDVPSGAGGDANNDGSTNADDRFVEIVNTASVSANLTGYTLQIPGGNIRHVFPPGSVVPAGCAIVIFDNGTPTGSFGTAVVQVTSTGNINLNTTGRAIEVHDPQNNLAVAYTFVGTSNDNMSQTRSPDISGGFALHASAPGSGGTLFSPGTKLSGAFFDGCSGAPTPTATPSCCQGDADNSGGAVNANDFLAVQANFGANHGVGGLGDADCSGGAVNANDFLAVQANFGAGCG